MDRFDCYVPSNQLQAACRLIMFVRLTLLVAVPILLNGTFPILLNRNWGFVVFVNRLILFSLQDKFSRYHFYFAVFTLFPQPFLYHKLFLQKIWFLSRGIGNRSYIHLGPLLNSSINLVSWKLIQVDEKLRSLFSPPKQHSRRVWISVQNRQFWEQFKEIAQILWFVVIDLRFINLWPAGKFSKIVDTDNFASAQ